MAKPFKLDYAQRTFVPASGSVSASCEAFALGEMLTVAAYAAIDFLSYRGALSIFAFIFVGLLCIFPGLTWLYFSMEIRQIYQDSWRPMPTPAAFFLGLAYPIGPLIIMIHTMNLGAISNQSIELALGWVVLIPLLPAMLPRLRK